MKIPTSIRAAFALGLVAVVIAFHPHGASAVTYYWDSNGTTAGFGNTTGTWAAPTVSRWSTSSAGTAAVGASITTTTSDTVNFGTATLNYANASIAVGAAGVTATSIVFGEGQTTALTVGGTGTITLGGATRTIVANSSGHGITAPIEITWNATVSLAVDGNSSATSLSLGAISGNGNMIFQNTAGTNPNPARFTLNGVSTYSGTTLLDSTVINANIELRLGVNNALPTTTVLTIDGGNGTGSGRSADLNMNGKNQTLAGLTNTTVSLRTQDVFNSTGTLSTLTINDNSTRTFSGRIGAGGTNIAVAKEGSGTWVLTGTNSYTGDTTINAGAIRINNASGLGSTAGNTTVNANGRLELVNNITVTGEALTISGTGGNFFGALQSQNGDNTWAGSVLIGADETRLGSADGANRVLRISGVIGDGGNGHSIAVRHEFADAILEFSGANTYGGATKIFNGVLRIAGGDNRLPIGTSLDFGAPANAGGFTSTFDLNGFNQRVAGLTSVDSGTPDVITLTNSGVAKTFTVNTEVDNNYGGLITGNLALTKAGNGSLTLTGDNTFTGNVTVQDGVLNIRHDSALGSTGKTVTVAQSGQTPALELQDNINVTVGTLRTSGLGIGGNGVLRNISGNNTISATDIHLIGGNGNSEWQSDAGLLTVNGDISDQAGVGFPRTLFLDGAGDGLITGAMSNGDDVLSLTKNGTGTWTFTGPNTYTGATAVNDGILQIGNGGVSGTLGNNSNTSIASGAELRINRTDGFGYDYTGTLSGSGTVNILAGGRRMNFRDNNQTSSGNLSFVVDGILGIRTSSGVTDVHLGELSGTGIVQRAGPAGGAATLFIGGKNTSSTYSGTIGFAELSVDKVGSGTLVLSGANTYGGTTTVTDGELIVNGSHAGGGLYTVASGARLGGDGSIGANVTVASAHGDLSPGDAGYASAYDGSFSYSAGTDFQTVGLLDVVGNINLGGYLLLDVMNAGQDLLDIDGQFTINSNPNAQLEINGATDLTTIDFWNILGWTNAGQSLDLVQFESFGGGVFANVAFNEYFDDASGRQVMLGLDGDSIFIASTPEPASVALWILIGLMASVVARRQVALRRALVLNRKDR